MRGKAIAAFPKHHASRITPAYAGKSTLIEFVKNATRDHPRLCGEKVENIFQKRFQLGSPPPMRGKAMKLMLWQKAFRITPAYAGKSQHRKRNSGKSEDHPRLCGEKWRNAGNSWKPTGSPPPMRGKEVKASGINFVIRITPAYAGKSMVSGVCSPELRDHPRLCGEKRRFASLWLPVVGSPPPMRGKVGIRISTMADSGITPAYAGKRITWNLFLNYNRDHPRLCGEKYKPSKSKFRGQGSPPPMRGKGQSGARQAQSAGITPAYAGKSYVVSSACPRF